MIGRDIGEDNTQCLLKVLRTFVLEAPHPPLSLIKEACNIFAIHKSIDDVVNIIKIFTSQSTLKDREYMQNLLKILIRALRKSCGIGSRTNEVALVLIVKYLCVVAAQMDSKQEVGITVCVSKVTWYIHMYISFNLLNTFQNLCTSYKETYVHSIRFSGI